MTKGCCWGDRLRSTATIAVSIAMSIGAIALSQSANASLAEYLSVGNAKALAMGNAVTADPPGIDSIQYNPAGLSRLGPGTHYTFKGILPDLSVKATINHATNDVKRPELTSAGQWDFMCAHEIVDPEFWGYDDGALDRFRNACENNEYPDPIVSETNGIGFMLPGVKLQNVKGPIGGPGFAMAWQPEGTNFTIGTGVYADFLGLGRPEDDPARFNGILFSQVRLSFFTPTVSYRFNDQLAVGVGANFSWQGMGMDMALRLPNIALQLIDEVQDGSCDFSAYEEGLLEDGEISSTTAGQIVGTAIDFCGSPFGPYSPVGRLSLEVERKLSVGYTFGVLWTPTDWISFGLNYRPEVEDEMDGEFVMEYSENWSELFGDLRRGKTPDGDGSSLPQIFDAFDLACEASLGYQCFPYGSAPGTNITPDGAGGFEDGKVTITLPQPALLSVGTSMQITPRWKVNVDARWVDYESWGVLPVDFHGQNLDFLRIVQLLATVQYPGQDFITDSTFGIPFWFESVWHFAFGTEYRWSDRLTLRAGWEPRRTSIPDDRVSLFAPFGDVDLYGLGFTYQMGSTSQLDFAFGHIRSKRHIPANSSDMVNSIGDFDYILNVYPGSDITAEVIGNFLEVNYHTTF